MESHHSISLIISLKLFSPNTPLSLSAHRTEIPSINVDSKIGLRDSGMQHFTNPAPHFNADNPVNMAAPVIPFDPAITSIFPCLYLYEFFGGG